MRLLQFETGERVQRAELFVSPVGQRDLTASLVPPSEPHALVADIKERLAEKDAKPWVHEFVEYGGGKGDDPRRLRQAPWSSLAQRYIKLAAKSAEVKLAKGQPLWALLPSFRDQATHNQYRNALRAVLTDAFSPDELNFLIEPEMVLEYFRLIRRSLPVTSGGNPLYLVIDCGALTCNISVVIGTRGGASMAQAGNWRGVLQPISGATKRAGRWVDEELAKQLQGAFVGVARPELLRLAEVVKLRLSEQESLTVQRHSDGKTVILNQDVIRGLVGSLWARCQEELEQVLAVTYKQLSDPKADNGHYAEGLAAKQVSSPRDLVKLLTAVVFAGGSSQLPGFRERAVEWLGWKGEVLEVGPEYAAVPALGAAAHVLHRAGKLVWAGPDAGLGTESRQPAVESVLVGSLPDDVVFRGTFGARPQTGPRQQRDVEVVGRDGWSVGMSRSSEVPLPAEWLERPVSSALVWRSQLPNGKHNHVTAWGGQPWREFDGAQERKSRLSIKVVDGTIAVSTIGTSPIAAHHIDLKKLNHGRSTQPEALAAPRSDSPAVVTAAIGDVFVDFGMSKTIFVRADQAMVLQIDHFANQASIPIPSVPVGWALRTPVRPKTKIDELRELLATAISEREQATSLVEVAEQGRARAEIEAQEARQRASSESELRKAEQVSRHDAEVAVSAALVRIAELAATVERNSGDAERLREELRVARQAGASDALRWDALIDHRLAPSEMWLPTETELIDRVVSLVGSGGFEVDPKDVVHAYLSLKQTPLLFFSGPPGVGKSTLAQRILHALGLREESGHVAVVAVEAEWTSHAMAMGADAAGRRFSPSALLRAAYSAHLHPDALVGVVLEECNLAQIDYYLAPLLNAMAGTGTITVPSGADGPIRGFRIPMAAPGHRLFIFGTMNVDEAGTTLTDKVLDRAGLVELGPSPLGEAICGSVAPMPVQPGVSGELWGRFCAVPNRLGAAQLRRRSSRLLPEPCSFGICVA